MVVSNVLHMNGGVGETSYSNNSLMQQKVILMTKAIIERAITDLYCSIFPKSISIEDLGCSSGPNTLLVISEIIKMIDYTRRRLDHESPELQIFFNDLPDNDFNTIFRSLSQFQEKLRKEMGPGFGHCFFAGVPGSFHDRLFPTESIHFIYSSYSIHWLSQVPEGVESNKGNIYIASTSPPDVPKAYYHQFHKDLSMFQKCRSVEVVTGGRMILTFVGRKSENPSSAEGCLPWELLAKSLNNMVSEDLIKEESLDSFNIPIYTPSPTEIKSIVEEEGSFTIDHLETSEIHWNASNPSEAHEDDGYSFMKCMRSVAEPMLVSHFDEGIIDEVYRRYQENIADCMSKEKPVIINVIVSMTRKPR